MKTKFFAVLITFILILSPISVRASSETGDSVLNGINIATIDNRPLYIDRLLYAAFKDIGYNMSVEALILQSAYELANSGEKNGVIAATPDMMELYPNLKQVPVVLDEAAVNAFTREGSNITVNDWEDLKGLSVGILTNRVYILSKIPQDVSIIAKETSALLMEGLVDGEYDVIILALRSHETFDIPDNIKKAGVIESFPEYLYLHKDYEYLIPEVTKALTTIFSDGRSQNILNDIHTPETGAKRTILHIISSNSEITRQESFINELKKDYEHDDSIEWYTIAFDTRRFTADTSRTTYFSNLLRAGCVSRNIAAVVVSGDFALDFVKDYYYLLFRNTPVLFYSVNETNHTDINHFSPYFTGIYESLSAEETLNAALSIFPETTNLYVLNDYTAEGRNYRAAMEEQISSFSGKLNIVYSENESLYMLADRIKELPQSSIVFLGTYFRDSNGQYYSQSELRRILDSSCDKPVITMFSTELAGGAIGGKCSDYKKFGSIISDMLRKILNGKSAGEIPVLNSSLYNRWVFDKKIMDNFGVKESSLPGGSEIINKTPSVWESDPLFVIAIIALSLVGIIMTVALSMFVYRRNKRKENLRTEKALKGKDVKIKEVSERLERIIETSPVSFVISIDDIIVDFNEEMGKNFGVKTGDMISSIYDDNEQRKIYLDRIMRGEILKNEIVRFKFTDGKVHRCFINIATTEYNGRKAVAAWIIDIEQDQEKNDQLRIARENLQSILDTMPLPVSIVNCCSKNVVYGNNAFLKMLGYKSGYDLYGLKAEKIIADPQSDGTSTVDLCEKLLTEMNPNGIEIQSLMADGTVKDTRFHTTNINYNGAKSIIGIITDLTNEKEYARMLLNTAEKEKEANQLKSRFLVNMSHEIRTPMNAIIGLTEIELRKELVKETKDIYVKINNSAKNLLNIINDILDLSKIEADKIELHDEEFELEDVVESAMLVATPRLDGKNVEFLLDASLDLPRFLIGDKTRLWQILKNFLDNSAKFTEKGKIVLTVSVDNEASDENNAFISFVIEDTGIGISDEQMQRLFVPYAQIYSEAQKRYTGSGLGMAISKQFCTLMGGSMNIHSSLGKGTTVYIKIPFKRSVNNETERNIIDKLELNGANILAVDDDELSLTIMKELLTGAGASCELAHSGEEAIKLIFEYRDMGKSFDAILLDYIMEGLNGIETAQRIQAGLSRAPKLLMVTAYQRLIIKGELEKNHIDDIIEKPFIPSQFIGKIHSYLTDGVDDTANEVSELPQFKGVTVLLCEDYIINQEVAIGMFSEYGIEAVIAENGKIGVEILKSGDTSFDMIFMDLQMPVMDGYEATRQIRQDSRFNHIPIISLTADAMKEVVNKCREAGMNDHLAKPIEFESLEKIFIKWLPDEKRTDLGRIKTKIKENKLIVDTEKDKSTSKEAAIARFGGKIELYKKALCEFAKDLPENWPSFEEAVYNIEETKRDIHKIKGAAGNLSETDIYEYAREFESSLRLEKPDKTKYDMLISACADFKRNLNCSDKGSSGVKSGTKEEFIENIRILNEALQEYDLKKCTKAINTLKEKEWPVKDSGLLESLYNLVENYDYDAAIDAINSLI